MREDEQIELTTDLHGSSNKINIKTTKTTAGINKTNNRNVQEKDGIKTYGSRSCPSFMTTCQVKNELIINLVKFSEWITYKNL